MVKFRRYWRRYFACGLALAGLSAYLLIQFDEESKVLREWLAAISLPIVIAIGGYGINEQFKQRQAIAASERRYQELLNSYMQQMSVLMSDKGLMEAPPEQPVSRIAKALTMTALRKLDPVRKNQVIQFLLDANLLQTGPNGRLKGPALFSNANLSDIELGQIALDCANLNGAILFWTNLHGATFRGAQFQQANLTGTDLSHTDLEETNFRGAELIKVELNGAHLQQANLRYAKLFDSNLAKANLKGANLSFSKLSACNLNETNLEGANLEGAKLCDANLKGANLSGASLFWANLSGADLEDADLRGANLSEANLMGVDLSKTHVQGATFRRARYNAKTIYPKTFNPNALGMMNMERKYGILND